MKVTPRTVINDAFRALGVLRPGHTPAEDAVDEALRLLNDILDSWQLEKLMVYAVSGTGYVIPAAGSYFTMGPTGTLSTAAPVKVESAGWLKTGMPEQPIEVLTLDRWRAGQQGIYLDGVYPLTTLHVNPAAMGGETLMLYAWALVTSFVSADLPYDFPPGYSLALRWNLALQLAPSALINAKIPTILYNRIEAQAIESKATIKSFHSEPPPELSIGDDLGCGCGTSYDIYTDRY